MLPNARLEGLGESIPGVTPSPERLSTTLLFTLSALVANVTLPLKLPLPVGANVIVAEVAVSGVQREGQGEIAHRKSCAAHRRLRDGEIGSTAVRKSHGAGLVGPNLDVSKGNLRGTR